MGDSTFTAKPVRYFTASDQCVSQVLTYVQKGWPDQVQEKQLRSCQHLQTKLTSHDGCLLWEQRVVIPLQGRTTVLQELHNGHYGITRIKGSAQTVVQLPKLDKEIEIIVHSCAIFQEQQEDPPTLPWNRLTRPWSRLYIDYLGPFLDTFCYW